MEIVNESTLLSLLLQISERINVEVNILFLVVSGLLFTFAVYMAWEKHQKARDLLKALYEEQQLKNDISVREQERQQEFNFIETQSIALIQDIANLINKGDMQIQGVGFDYRNDLMALVHVLQETPKNYLSNQIGEFELDVKDGEFNGLIYLLERAPNLSGIRYIELLVIIRIMFTQKVDLTNAYAMFESNT